MKFMYRLVTCKLRKMPEIKHRIVPKYTIERYDKTTKTHDTSTLISLQPKDSKHSSAILSNQRLSFADEVKIEPDDEPDDEPIFE